MNVFYYAMVSVFIGRFLFPSHLIAVPSHSCTGQELSPYLLFQEVVPCTVKWCPFLFLFFSQSSTPAPPTPPRPPWCVPPWPPSLSFADDPSVSRYCDFSSPVFPTGTSAEWFPGYGAQINPFVPFPYFVLMPSGIYARQTWTLILMS